KREKGGSYTIFSIRLVHKMDKHKFVDLYKSLSSIDYREKTESYAKLLNMPILTVTKDGYSKRMPAQLDTPLIHQTQNQIDAEKLQPIDLSKSTYIKVETLGNQPCLTISQKKAAWIGMVLCISFGIVAGLAWGDRNIVATIVASLMSLLGIYISIKSLLSKEVIVVSRDGVTTFTIFLGTKSQELHIPLQDIEEVKVAKHDRGNLAVQIISDRKIIDIGQHLPKEEKRQLATYIEQQIKQYGREG
ncbi:MAG: hypothetical protein KDD52_09500, partial [Bdellovibrionales bacterium]|nr:hypothetical protein [Bdellovibrionales bacterium]